MPMPPGKKNSTDGTTWSFSIFLWAHNDVEPRPDQLQQPQIIALHPQAYMVGTRHDKCITSSPSRLTLMRTSL